MDTAALVMALTSLTSGGGGGTSNVKVFSDTLSAGDTTITFSDTAITAASFVAVAANVWYTATTQSSGSVSITFPEQSSDMDVVILVAN